MDRDRFDNFARSIASGVTRRKVIRGLFTGGLAVVAARAIPASARPEKVAICKPTGSSANPYALIEIPWHVAEKLQDRELFSPYDCDDGPTCTPCCVEIDLPCSSDADCCSENCLPSGICGGLCYCHDYFDADEQAAKGPMCGGSTGGLCSSGTLPGCLSSADCDQSSSYTECVVPTDGCNASGGMCAYPLFPCEE